MENLTISTAEHDQLKQLVKIGLIRELHRRRHITQAQFEQLMQLQQGR